MSIHQLLKVANKFENRLNKSAEFSQSEIKAHITSYKDLYNKARAAYDGLARLADNPSIKNAILHTAIDTEMKTSASLPTLTRLSEKAYKKSANYNLSLKEVIYLKDKVNELFNNYKKNIYYAFNNFRTEGTLEDFNALINDLNPKLEASIKACGFAPVQKITSPAKISEGFKTRVMACFIEKFNRGIDQIALDNIMSKIIEFSKLNNPDAKVIRQSMYSESTPTNLDARVDYIINNILDQQEGQKNQPSPTFSVNPSQKR